MIRPCLVASLLLALSAPAPGFDVMIESHEIPLVVNTYGWLRQNGSMFPWTPFDSTRQYWDLTVYPGGRIFRVGLKPASTGRPPAPDSMANDPPPADVCEFDTSGTGAITWRFHYKTNFGLYMDGIDFDNVYRFLGNYHPDYPVYLTPVYYGASWAANSYWVCDTGEVPYMANERHAKKVLARGKVKVPMSSPYYWPCLVVRDSMAFNDEWDTRYTRWVYEWLVPGVFLGANPAAAAWSPRGALPNFNYVEDMLLLGSVSIPGRDVVPPTFSDVRVWPDTNYPGPYKVWATIADDQAVGAESLFFRVNSGNWSAVGPDSSSGSRYCFTIPKVTSSATIDYYVWAKDTFCVKQNIDLWTTWPVCAPESAAIRFVVSNVGLASPGDVEPGDRGPQVHPNPFRSTVALRVAYGGVSLRIYNSTGRCIRTLPVPYSLLPTPYSVTWDGRDQFGKLVGPGVYLCELSSSAPSTTCRLVKLK